MQRLAYRKQLGLAALLGAAIALGPAQHALAQDSTETAALSSAVAATDGPGAIPETSVLPALDNPPEPGDAFPTMPFGNTE